MKKNCTNLALCIFPTAGVPVQYCEQPTNGISYFRAISSITDIPEELREYLPLFCYILTKYDVISFAAVLSFVLKASNFAVALVFHQLHVFLSNSDWVIWLSYRLWLAKRFAPLYQPIKQTRFPALFTGCMYLFRLWLARVTTLSFFIARLSKSLKGHSNLPGVLVKSEA